MSQTIMTKKWRFVTLVQTFAMLECLVEKADGWTKPLYERQLITLRAIDTAAQVPDDAMPDDLVQGAMDFVGMFYGELAAGFCPLELIPDGAKHFEEEKSAEESTSGD